MQAMKTVRALSLLTISAMLLFACGGGGDDDAGTGDTGGTDAGGGADTGPAGPIEIISFTASMDSISPGANVVLEWEVRGARVIEIGTNDTTLVATFDGTGIAPSANLFETTRYILTARAGDSMETRELTVTVVWPEPAILSFDVNPQATTINNIVTMTWTTQNAQYLRILKDDVEF